MKTTMTSALLLALSAFLFALALGACTSTDLGSTGAAVSGAGDACVASSDCATGLECEHGTCQPHQRHARGDDDRDAGTAAGDDDDRDRDAGAAADDDGDGEHHDGRDDGDAHDAGPGGDDHGGGGEGRDG